VEDVVRLLDHSVRSLPVVSGDEAVVFHFLHEITETDRAGVSHHGIVRQQFSTAERFITPSLDDRSAIDYSRLKKTKGVSRRRTKC
jgi:hypothetical protein